MTCPCNTPDGVEFWCDVHGKVMTRVQRQRCIEHGTWWTEFKENVRQPGKRTSPVTGLPPSQHEPRALSPGPGTELHKYFRSWGFLEYKGCGCRAYARKMNEWGCDECERRLESEIVPWVVQQFEKRRSSKEAKAATGRMARLAVIAVSPEEVPELARIAVMDAIRRFRREASPSQDRHNGPLTPDVR